MAMFPVLQWVYRNDITKREGVPQLAYGIEGIKLQYILRKPTISM